MALPFDLNLKDPSTILILAGVASLGTSFISKKSKVMGVTKKNLKYGGAILIVAGLAWKYMGKKKGVVTQIPTNGGIRLPPTTGSVGLPNNILQGVNPGMTYNPSIAGRSRRGYGAAATKANFAGRNTLPTMYGSHF